MSGLCDGKVVIVTGAGRGLGREHALMLARQGARVVINDIGVTLKGDNSDDVSVAESVVREIREAGGEAVANTEDIADWQGAKRLIEQAIDQFGRLDGLVNNAGTLRDCPLVDMDEAEWDGLVRVHLKGAIAPSRHAASYWRDEFNRTGQPVGGRIINTTSTSGIYGNLNQTHYGPAKAGVASFTVIAARELRQYGVTVNAIAPGAQTRMTEGRKQWTPEQLDLRHPRFTSALVTWLASDEAADVTGRVFQSGNGILAVCEGWRRGATEGPIDDPEAIGPVLRDMIGRVKLNVGMDGVPLD